MGHVDHVRRPFLVVETLDGVVEQLVVTVLGFGDLQAHHRSHAVTLHALGPDPQTRGVGGFAAPGKCYAKNDTGERETKQHRS